METFLYLLARGVIGFLRRLPLETVGHLGRFLGAVVYYLDRRHRRMAEQNLQAAFPERSAAEVKALARENFKRIGENYASAIKTAYMPNEALAHRIEIIDGNRLMTNFEGKRNIIVAIGHFGNFEIYARTRWAAPGFQFATTYRGLKQPSLNRLMQSMRERSNCWFFERRTDAAGLKLALNKGKLLLGLLADQHAGRGGAWLPFFGRLCSTSTAPAVLALRYDAKLHAAFCCRVKLGYWRIEVTPEIPLAEADGSPRDVEAITSDINREFEAAVRRDPANWFWVHNRWKKPPAPTQRAAPDHATL